MELYNKQIDQMVFQTSPQLEELGVKHGFTTRYGGVSEGIYSSLNLGFKSCEDKPDTVRENYRRICSALNIDIMRTVLSKQVHSDNVKIVTEDDMGKGLYKPADYDADGFVTDIPGVALFVFGADCLTALMHDPVKKVIAAVHAGWRGTALGIAKKAVETMRDVYGCDAENIRVALGPCISKCCFETDSDVPDAMIASFSDQALPYIDKKENGKFMVDLKGLNAMQLENVGILCKHIDISPDCTMCLPEKYWSHRKTQGKRGIQAGVVCL